MIAHLLHHFPQLAAQRTPDAVAIICADRQLTYGELNGRANQLAHHLRKSGVEPETAVAVCMERSPEMVVALLGILKAGGAYVPLDPAYPDERLGWMIEDAQAPVLLSGTLRENMLLGLPADARLEWAVRAAALEHDIASFPDGLETVIGARGMKLSGGQIQRTAAARMFVREPDLLVFDDLSSALDTETEAELWSRLFARGREVTCLVVSHRPAALRRADQVLLMDSGRLVARGRLEELLDSSPQMRDLWRSAATHQRA